jgi:hypothetical protein
MPRHGPGKNRAAQLRQSIGAEDQSGLAELKELWALTEECVAQARVAKQQAQRYAAHFKSNSEEFIKLAARSRFPEIQARLLRVAAANERLCSIAKDTDARAQAEGPVMSRRETTVARSEDPVSQARRHVAEAEARIERQKALVAGLSDSSKHPQLVGQGNYSARCNKHFAWRATISSSN